MDYLLEGRFGMMKIVCVLVAADLVFLMSPSASWAVPVSGTFIPVPISGQIDYALYNGVVPIAIPTTAGVLSIDSSSLPTFNYNGQLVAPAVRPIAASVNAQVTASYVIDIPTNIIGGLFDKYYGYDLTLNWRDESQSSGMNSKVLTTFANTFTPENTVSFYPARTVAGAGSASINLSSSTFYSTDVASLVNISIGHSEIVRSQPSDIFVGGMAFQGRATIQIFGTAHLQVNDFRADEARSRALSNINTSSKLSSLFSSLRILESAAGLAKAINAAVTESQGGALSSEALADLYSAASEVYDSADEIAPGDVLSEKSPSARSVKEVLQAEIDKIIQNPAALSDFGPTRLLQLMDEISIQLDYLTLSDPPRFDYHKIQRPAPFTLSSEDRSLLGDPVSHYIEARMQLIQFGLALLVANERYQGAVISGDDVAALKQAGLAEELTSGYAYLFDEFRNTLSALLVELESRALAQGVDAISLDFLSSLSQYRDDLWGLISAGQDSAKIQYVLAALDLVSDVRLDSFGMDAGAIVSPYASDDPRAPNYGVAPVPLPPSGVLAVAFIGLLAKARLFGQLWGRYRSRRAPIFNA